MSAATLQTISAIAVAIIGVGGSSIGALIGYQTWQRKKQPVIADIGDWRTVVSAQRLWLDNIDAYINILTSNNTESAIVELRQHTWQLAFEKEKARLETLRAEAENIRRSAAGKNADYVTRTIEALPSPSQAIRQLIAREGKEIESQENQKAIILLDEVSVSEKANEERHRELPTGRLTNMFTEEPAPALLQLRQGRAAIAACRRFNSTIDIIRKLAAKPRVGWRYRVGAIMRWPVRRDPASYRRKAIALLSKAQAKLTEISYIKPELLLTMVTDSEESGTGK